MALGLEVEDHPDKDEVIIMTEKAGENPESFNSSNNIYAEEITLEHCVMFHKDLVKTTAKPEMSAPEIVDKITAKLREFNVFKNFSASKFYDFLLQAELNLFITSFFDEGKNLMENRDFEELCEEAIRSASAELIKYVLAWANTKENLIEIVYLIATRN